MRAPTRLRTAGRGRALPRDTGIIVALVARRRRNLRIVNDQDTVLNVKDHGAIEQVSMLFQSDESPFSLLSTIFSCNFCGVRSGMNL